MVKSLTAAADNKQKKNKKGPLMKVWWVIEKIIINVGVKFVKLVNKMGSVYRLAGLPESSLPVILPWTLIVTLTSNGNYNPILTLKGWNWSYPYSLTTPIFDYVIPIQRTTVRSTSNKVSCMQHSYHCTYILTIEPYRDVKTVIK